MGRFESRLISALALNIPMEIECVFFGPIRETTNTKTTIQTIEEGITVAELVRELTSVYDDLEADLLTDGGNIRDGIVFTVNKRHISHLDGQSTVLSDGDTVRITTSVQGG